MQCFSASISLYLTVDQGQVRRPAVSAARSFDQGFAHLYQVLPDGDMLGTGFLAFSALDAFVRPFQPMSAYKPSLLILCQGGIAVESQIIHGREGSGDADIHGAHLRTVIAGRTGDQRNPFQLFLGLLQCLLLAVRQSAKCLHIGKVILHLFHIAHSGQHGDHAFQIRRKTDRPGRHGAFRLG